MSTVPSPTPEPTLEEMKEAVEWAKAYVDSDSFKRAIAHIEDLVNERNKHLDGLRNQIEHIERRMLHHYKGRAAAVEFPGTSSPLALLWWVRGGWWGFYVLDHDSMILLVNAPKDIRVAAVPLFEDLLLQLQYEVPPDANGSLTTKVLSDADSTTSKDPSGKAVAGVNLNEVLSDADSTTSEDPSATEPLLEGENV